MCSGFLESRDEVVNSGWGRRKLKVFNTTLENSNTDEKTKKTKEIMTPK